MGDVHEAEVGRHNRRLSRAKRSRTICFLLVSTIVTSGMASCSRSCDDSYAPDEPSSCSYNPALAKLEEERDAQVSEAPLADTRGHVYLIVSPGVVVAGEAPQMTLLNNTDEVVGYAPSFSLTKSNRPQRDLTAGCVSELGRMTLQPGDETEPELVSPCRSEELTPGWYSIERRLYVGSSETNVVVSGGFKVATSTEP